MANNYYYTVSGLADLSFDSSKKTITFVDALSDFQQQVAFDELPLLSAIRYPYDNYNLITLILKKERSFDVRGNYSLEKLEQLVKCPENIPEYMLQFLEMFKEEKMPFPDYTLEDQLAWLFYEEMVKNKKEITLVE